MEPINQKERTTAFIQFMVMFVIAIILVLCLALFDVKLCHDDYADLKAKLKNNSQISDPSSTTLHEMQDILKQIQSMDPAKTGDISAIKYDLSQKYFNAYIVSENGGNVNDSIKDVFRQISNLSISKTEGLSELLDCNAKISKKIETIKTLKSMLISTGVSEDKLNAITKED